MTTNPIAEHRLDTMNLLVLAAQLLGWASCLVWVTRLDNPYALGAIVIFFCLMMQGVFSMMHECFHGHGHSNHRINYLMCWLASTIFGASATFIKVNHMGHHVRNRTRAELVDYVEDDESRFKKTFAYYAAIFGGIWIGALVASVLLVFVPSRWAQRLQSQGEANTYAAALADFTARDFQRIRIEVISAATFWLGAWWLLALSWYSLLLLYAAFALSWSSLQWIYHVRTPLHVVEGTYNIRSPWFVRYLFLNFNYNLTHHRDPGLRWQLMHKATNLAETRPFWRTWLAILKPPQPIPENRVITKTYF